MANILTPNNWNYKFKPLFHANISIYFFQRQNESSLYDELTFQDSEVINEVDDGVDITGQYSTCSLHLFDYLKLTCNDIVSLNNCRNVRRIWYICINFIFFNSWWDLPLLTASPLVLISQYHI